MKRYCIKALVSGTSLRAWATRLANAWPRPRIRTPQLSLFGPSGLALLLLLLCSAWSGLVWSGLWSCRACEGVVSSGPGRGRRVFCPRESGRVPPARLLQRPSSWPPCTLVASSRLRPASALHCSALRCASRRPAACWPRRVGGRGRREEGGARAGEGAGVKEHCFDSDTEHRQARAPSSAAVLHARASRPASRDPVWQPRTRRRLGRLASTRLPAHPLCSALLSAALLCVALI